MTIQIVRRNDRYYVRRKGWLAWTYLTDHHFWVWWPNDGVNDYISVFKTFSDACVARDKVIAGYIAEHVEKISPLVIEDSHEV